MNIWDKTKPTPSEYVNTLYEYLRNLKELFLDRFGLDHNMDGILDPALATADGFHKQLTMPDFNYEDGYGGTITEPEYITGSQQMFVKKIDGLDELCIQNEDGIYQVTKDGYCNLGDEEIISNFGSASLKGIVSFNNKLYAYSNSNARINEIIDETTLSAITTTPENGGGQMDMIVFNDVCYIALMGTDSYTKIYSTSDMISFTLRFTFSVLGYIPWRLYVTNGKLFLAFRSNDYYIRLAYTSNGVDYTETIVSTESAMLNQYASGIVYFRGLYYVIPYYHSFIRTGGTITSRHKMFKSSDLSSWTSVDLPVLTEWGHSSTDVNVAVRIYEPQIFDNKLVIPFGAGSSTYYSGIFYSENPHLLISDLGAWYYSIISNLAYIHESIKLNNSLYLLSINKWYMFKSISEYKTYNSALYNYSKPIIHKNEIYTANETTQSIGYYALLKYDRSL